MKSRLIFQVVVVLLLMSCENIHDLNKLKVDKITYGDCKTDSKKSENAERIEYKTVDKDYLEIKHINGMFNCDPGRILVNVSEEDNIVSIDENEEYPIANCICPYDLCYRIGPIDYGYYIFDFQRDGLKYVEFPVDFNSKTSGVFEIDQ
jgi:hypothetical protein